MLNKCEIYTHIIGRRDNTHIYFILSKKLENFLYTILNPIRKTICRSDFSMQFLPTQYDFCMMFPDEKKRFIENVDKIN